MAYSPVETEILISLLLVGKQLPVQIADSYDRHPSSVGRCLNDLADRGLVASERGIWHLTAPGVSEARGVVSRRVQAEA